MTEAARLCRSVSRRVHLSDIPLVTIRSLKKAVITLAELAVTVTLALALFGLVGCSGGIEGTYTLDKAEVKNAVRTELAGQSGGGTVFGFFTRIVDEVDMTLELQADGKATLKSSLPTGGWAGPQRLQWVTMEDKRGMWKAEGETIVINAAGNSLKCSKSWTRLRCEAEKKLLFPLIFVKS